MDNMQDDIELDIENNRTVFLRESDPFLPIIPSPGIQEKPLEERLNFRHSQQHLYTPPMHLLRKTIQIWITLRLDLALPPMTQTRRKNQQHLGKELKDPPL